MKLLASLCLGLLLVFLVRGKTYTKEACEGYYMKLSCDFFTVIEIVEATYQEAAPGECYRPYNEVDGGCSADVTDQVDTMCQQTICHFEAKNQFFGDPCPNILKKLHVLYRCRYVTWLEPMVSYACESNKLNLDCPLGHHLNIAQATYGRPESYCVCDPAILGIGMVGVPCSSISGTAQVKAECDGKRWCEIDATNAVFTDPCGGIFKFLQVDYECVKNSRKPQSKKPKKRPHT